MALVTVVVPTFNRPDFLQNTLESIGAQTFTDFTVVVADDCGDVDLSPVKAAWQSDDRFVFIRHATNLGVGPGSWAAFKQVGTRYTATINDDDMWEPTFLEVLVAALEAHPEATVAFCDTSHIDGTGRSLPHSADAVAREYGRLTLAEGLHRPFIFEGVARRTIAAAGAAVFRTSAMEWGDLPSEVADYYDEWLEYLAVRTGGAVWYTPARLSRYRVHQESKTASNHRSLSWRLRHRCQDEAISREKLADAAVKQCHPMLRRRNRRALFGLVIAAVLNDKREMARARIGAARHLHPPPVIASLRALTMIPTSLAQAILNVRIRLSRPQRLGTTSAAPVL